MVAKSSSVKHRRISTAPTSTIRSRAVRLSLFLAALVSVAFAVHWYGLSLNITDSMPIGFYHYERRIAPVARGTIVQSCLPEAVASIGQRQGYLPAGSCPGGAAPVLKIAAAVGGDRLQLLDHTILVNGHALRGSGTLSIDSQGRALAHVVHGPYLLRRGEIWLWSPNPASWDSRYYGPVPERAVLGRARLLLPLERWKFGNIGS